MRFSLHDFSINKCSGGALSGVPPLCFWETSKKCRSERTKFGLHRYFECGILTVYVKKFPAEHAGSGEREKVEHDEDRI